MNFHTVIRPFSERRSRKILLGSLLIPPGEDFRSFMLLALVSHLFQDSGIEIGLTIPGSEAVEAALKLARQYYLELPTPQAQRTRFIARLPSYHGITLGALATGGHLLRREPFEPLLAQNTSHVSPCFAYRGKKENESDADYVARLVAELDAEFLRVGPENVCAFIAEPVVGAVSTLILLSFAASFPTNKGPRRRPCGPRLLLRHESRLRSLRRPLYPRRGHERHGPLRHPARLGTGRRRPRPPNHRQGPGRWLRACVGRVDWRSYRADDGQGNWCFSTWTDISGPSDCVCGGVGGAEGYSGGEFAGEC